MLTQTEEQVSSPRPFATPQSERERESADANRLVISTEEIQQIRRLLAEISSEYSSVENELFQQTATLYAHELPRRIRAFLTNARLTERPSFMIVSGFPIDDEKIGLTPGHWPDRTSRPGTLEAEFLFVLFASLLGDVIAWSTQQSGRIVHDVFPIKAHANEQISTGSEQPIWWHTEDAFHEMRGDYIGLMCLRNHDRIATTVCPLDCVPLKSRQVGLLSQPLFTIRPDESHQRKNAASAAASENGAGADFSKIEEMGKNPKKVPILAGAADEPYIRIDPYFMDPLDDAEVQMALNDLIRSIDERIQEVVLVPGDFCFIDNYRAVHGRRPFHASYNGRDRWLKRINVTRDLRKSRAHRADALTRVIS